MIIGIKTPVFTPIYLYIYALCYKCTIFMLNRYKKLRFYHNLAYSMLSMDVTTLKPPRDMTIWTLDRCRNPSYRPLADPCPATFEGKAQCRTAQEPYNYIYNDN